jgi:hypothetical protein
MIEMNEEEKIKIYEKTPLFKTIGHVIILSEAATMFYNTINSSKPVMDFLMFHKELYNSNIVPLFNSGLEYLINHEVKSGVVGASVLFGTGISTYFLNKFRNHVPTDEKYEKEKIYFLEEKIDKIYKYIKIPGYLIAGSTTLTSLISGTYNSFVQNNLNIFKNTTEISNNYFSLFVPIATIAAVYSSKPLLMYTSNIFRGVYEKGYMVYDSIKKSISNLFTGEDDELKKDKPNEIPQVKIEETVDLKTGINLYYFKKIENQEKGIVAYLRNDVPLDSEHKITPYLNEDVIKQGDNYFYVPGSKGKIKDTIFLDSEEKIVELINYKFLEEKDFKVKDLEKKVDSKKIGEKQKTIKK